MADNEWFLMFVQTHLTLREATSFKLFIMEWWDKMHPGEDIDFLEISHNEALLEEMAKLYKKGKNKKR